MPHAEGHVSPTFTTAIQRREVGRKSSTFATSGDANDRVFANFGGFSPTRNFAKKFGRKKKKKRTGIVIRRDGVEVAFARFESFIGSDGQITFDPEEFGILAGDHAGIESLRSALAGTPGIQALLAVQKEKFEAERAPQPAPAPSSTFGEVEEPAAASPSPTGPCSPTPP